MREKRKSEGILEWRFFWCWTVGLLVLLLEIAGIIIAIIAVCTKRTFLPPPFLWGMGTPLPHSHLLEKITKRCQTNNYFVSSVLKKN